MHWLLLPWPLALVHPVSSVRWSGGLSPSVLPCVTCCVVLWPCHLPSLWIPYCSSRHRLCCLLGSLPGLSCGLACGVGWVPRDSVVSGIFRVRQQMTGSSCLMGIKSPAQLPGHDRRSPREVHAQNVIKMGARACTRLQSRNSQSSSATPSHGQYAVSHRRPAAAPQHAGLPSALPGHHAARSGRASLTPGTLSPASPRHNPRHSWRYAVACAASAMCECRYAPVAACERSAARRDGLAWAGLPGRCAADFRRIRRDPTTGEIQGERERATPAENRSEIRSGTLGGCGVGECKPECTQVGECKFTTGFTK